MCFLRRMKQGNVLPCCIRICHQRGLRKLWGIWNERKVQANREKIGIKWNTVFVYADEANLAGESVYTIEEIKVALLHVNKDCGLK
jgi:hypothetical protein